MGEGVRRWRDREKKKNIHGHRQQHGDCWGKGVQGGIMDPQAETKW